MMHQCRSRSDRKNQFAENLEEVKAMSKSQCRFRSDGKNQQKGEEKKVFFESQCRFRSDGKNH